MTTVNENKLTKEQIEKAMACETAEELMAVAKAGGLAPFGGKQEKTRCRWRKR